MEIIPSQNLSELTDGKHPSVIPPVYTDGIISSVYTGGITDGEKFFFGNCNGGMTWIFFRRISDGNTEGFKPGLPNRDVSLTPAESPTVLPTEFSVGDAVGKSSILYCLC
jgi:hypothetical protein